MKMINSASGNFGPFNAVEILGDRYRTDGGDYCFDTIGEPHSVVDAEPGDLPTVTPEVPDSVTALQGLLAIEAAGGTLAADYEAWANHADRTFAEKAFINKAQTWKRDDPVLLAGAAALGLDSDAVDALFRAAALL